MLRNPPHGGPLLYASEISNLALKSTKEALEVSKSEGENGREAQELITELMAKK